MFISFETGLELLLCILAVVLFRSTLLGLLNFDEAATSAGPDAVSKAPSELSFQRGWDLDTPLPSAMIPSITVSPAQDEVPGTRDDGDHVASQAYDDRTVSFAQCAIVVEDMEPPSTTSSDTLPSPKTRGVPLQRGSDHIKICSVLAQTAENGKNTLRARPLTPFIKYTGEEPLTAEIEGAFETKDVSSVVIGKSLSGKVTSEDVAEIESVTFAVEEDMIRKPLLSAGVRAESK
ncbi:hypothetical protein NCC49_006511 [Naganishia albida]|nr:hypothetical protein NCC49_006511 [Naganishia albida]